MKYVIFLGFVWWAGREIYERFFSKKEGYKTKASMVADAQNKAEYGDQSDRNTIYDKVLENAVDIPENPYQDILEKAKTIPEKGIPKGYYGVKINSMKDKSVVKEEKMLPVEVMPNMCKYNESNKSIEPKKATDTVRCPDEYYTFFNNTFKNVTDDYYGITINSKNPEGKIISEKKMISNDYMPDGCKSADTIERGIVPISPTGNFQKDQEKCRDKFVTYGSGNQLKYDADNLSRYATNIEKTGSEKEDLLKKFDVNVNLVNPPPIYYEPGSYTFGAT
jgi:hypothetical protein